MRLVLDTATAACSAALIDDGVVIAAAHEVVGRGHAERLLPMVRDLLDGRRPASILVDCGPGSFTGVRVGIAAARALGLGWDIPVTGYSSLALIAAQALEETGGDRVTVAITGGHGELFMQSFAGTLAGAAGPLRSLPPAEAAAQSGDALVAGSGAEALIAARGWGQAHDMLPRAAAVCLLPDGSTALPPSPIYGRAPDAKASAG